MKKIYLFFLLFLGFIFSLQGQSHGRNSHQGSSIKGKIKGKLMDATSKEPLGYAVITLKKGGKVINGSISLESGKFLLPDIELGVYELELSFIGYKTQEIKEVELSAKKPDVNLGNIFLEWDNVMLGEIVVTEEKAIIENKIDRIVYHADKDVTNAGGDATDVLRKVPLLSVDLEGNVSLRGSSSIRILINGKPSGMFSENVAEALQMFPADQIKSVEVITSPSAKYDGEGAGGIINIITKKSSVEGFNSTVNLGIANRRHNGSLSLNTVKGRFGFNSSASVNYSIPIDGQSSFYREELSDGIVESILEQNGTTERTRLAFSGTAGAYYDFNAYNGFNTNFSLRGRTYNRDGDITSSFLNATNSINQTYARLQLQEELSNGFDWNTDYRKTFETPEEEFSIGFQLNGNNSNQDAVVSQIGNEASLFYAENTFNKGLNLEYTFQMDYVHPFGKNTKLEVGAKTVIRNIDSDYQYESFDTLTGQYFLDIERSDFFNYRQNVYAAYASLNFKLAKKHSIISGIRYERTNIEGDFKSDEPNFSNAYDNYLPSIIYSYKLENFSSIKLSFTQRIQRPSLFYINPYVNDNDRRDQTLGNPGLDPELTNQVDLGYSTFVKGTVVSAAIYYRKTNQLIEKFTSTNDGVSTTSFLNIGDSNSVGLNFFTSTTIKKIWSIRGSFDVYTYQIESNAEGISGSNDAIVYRAFISTSLTLKYGIKTEVFGLLNSPQFTLQGKRPTFSLLSFGIKKELFGKRGSIGIRIMEPFVENKSFSTEVSNPNFYQRSEFVLPFRSFGITFGYNFGEINFKAKNRKRTIKNDDLKEGADDNIRS